MSDATAQSTTTSQRPWLEITLIFIVFFVAGGAPVPHVNETHYLAKAKQYWQPDWCAGDLFLESGKAHLTFYWTVGLLTQWFELSTVAWIGRVAAWFALACGWQRLSASVSDLPLRGLLSALLLVTLIPRTNFAGEWVVGGVEGKCFAYAFVFWGLAALTTARWHRVWPYLGAACAFHALVGAWSVLAAGFVWLSLPRNQRLALPTMLPALLLGGALALPGILPALSLTQAVEPEVVEQANQIYVFDRLPHHLAPLTMKPSELSSKTLRFGLLLVGLAILRHCWCRAAAPSVSPAALRPLDLLMRFAVGALLISLCGLAWELATWNHPVLAARVLKYYAFRLADVAVPMATSLGMVWLAQTLLTRQRKLSLSLLLLAILLPCWHLIDLSWHRYQNPTPPAVKKMKAPAAWQEACRWVRENTPLDALFLVPRHAQSFKWYAHRSDLVTWKDMPQNATALVAWRDRYQNVHRYVDKQGQQATHRSLARQGTARIRQLAKDYQLDFVLTSEYPPLDLPVAFKNEAYTVYEIKNDRR